MNSLRSALAALLSAILLMPAGLAQQSQPGQAAAPAPAAAGVTLDRYSVPRAEGNVLTRPYKQPSVAPVNLDNSSRLDSLLRAGNLYLSLDDTIAIALENNLDIELSRYTPQLAQVDLLRAQAGGLLRGVPTSVRASTASVQSQVTGGTTGGTTGSSAQSAASSESGVGGTVITQTGVSIPSLDPTFFSSGSIGHRSSPQSNTITTGTTALAFDSRQLNLGYQQNFLTGTSFTYVWNNSYFNSNNKNSLINPGWNPNMQVQLTQRLLQGFGLAVNNRNIRVAKNNIKVGDLTFKQQVMVTVAGIVNLYWDLVSFNEDLKVKKKALEVAQKFYEDNKKQVQIGTLAPIEIVRAEARVAQAQQDLTNSETALLQQETIIKNALSRTGVASPSVAEARIIVTDSLAQPGNEQLDKLKDLVETALTSRPDLEQTRIGIENTKIAMSGSRSQLMPSLDVTAAFQNNSLSGSVNSLLTGYPPGTSPADAYFIGGYGNALAQIMRRNFPDYSVGFNLSIPVRNRTAQADYVRDQLTLRQSELGAQRQINDVRVNVQNALIAVIQAKARYESAVKERRLQEQTLDAENKKYALGASTAFQVVQTQRDLATAQGGEVTALASYSRARVQLDLQTAQILAKYNVQIDDAKSGHSSRPITPRN
ncbi:MAG: TolC family protein [Acidobacteria bacterium]|nr:TolC family protein [Acidobacteriota bacterium]